ncbi:hypothetical protein N7539_007121 [Penicillium diatomitis]|uniref:Uncharacterized protein n=1 Tax=Penicillium diatomitis TaxID=2819901 RepID=A0A9X0BNU8_9EURO|nr:uncharacterized protein N7539_007121 [Penicillium diatomitis]KAJ5476977.1 hypothetical protein N7539_007121 [Penicillium diatomitis]
MSSSSSSTNFNPLAGNKKSEEEQQRQTYTEWAKETYNGQYEKWMPWMEDQYLKWFGKGDNKASYATKGDIHFAENSANPKLTLGPNPHQTDTLSNTKVTGIDQVDKLQDDTNNLVGNQLGNNGLLRPVGQFSSKEGINRAERNGKDESGSYGGPASGALEKSKEGAGSVGSGLASGAESVSNATIGNIPGVKGMMGGGEKK